MADRDIAEWVGAQTLTTPLVAGDHISFERAGLSLQFDMGAWFVTIETNIAAKLDNNMSNNRILGRMTAGTGTVEWLTIAQTKTWLSLDITNSVTYAGVQIRTAAGTNKQLSYTTDGVARWFNRVSGAESGSNAGANYNLSRCDDAGSVIDTPFTITRSTGLCTITNLTSPLAVFTAAVTFPASTFATLPTASGVTGQTRRVTDRSQRLATSDGTNWRDQDGNILT